MVDTTTTNWENEPVDETPVKSTAAPETIKPIPRRGPGRPRKNSANETESPDAIISGPTKAKRGRRPKVRLRDNGEVEKSAQNIIGIHKLLSLATGFSELEVSPLEAAMLAESFDSVAREFDFAPSGKVSAILGLAGACSLIYIPRFVAINRRPKKMKANVSPIHPVENTNQEPRPDHTAPTRQEKSELDIVQQSHVMTEITRDK